MAAIKSISIMEGLQSHRDLQRITQSRVRNSVIIGGFSKETSTVMDYWTSSTTSRENPVFG